MLDKDSILKLFLQVCFLLWFIFIFFVVNCLLEISNTDIPKGKIIVNHIPCASSYYFPRRPLKALNLQCEPYSDTCCSPATILHLWRFAHSIDQLFWICQMVLSTYLISSSCLQILLPCTCTGSPTPLDSTTGKYGLEFSAGCNLWPTKKAAPMSSQTVNTESWTFHYCW